MTGTGLEVTPGAAAAESLPAGASLHRVEFRVDPAFVEFMRMSHDELLAAAPDSGAVERGEIGPNTQPHTLNLLLGSRNLQVQQLKRAQIGAVRTMLRNMALVMSKPLSEGGFGAPIWVFAKGTNGRVQRRETICVEPAQIPSLDIDVWIDPYSSAQRIAVQEQWTSAAQRSARSAGSARVPGAVHRRGARGTGALAAPPVAGGAGAIRARACRSAR